MRPTRSTATRLIVSVAAVLGVAGIVLAFPAEAGVPTSASVTNDCRNGEGYLHVLIEGSSQATFDIFIDDVLIGDGVGIGTHNYGPYADGTHTVQVVWFPDGPDTILDVSVLIACAPGVTTTTAAPTTTTTIPATTTTAPAAPPPPVVATPTYTG